MKRRRLLKYMLAAPIVSKIAMAHSPLVGDYRQLNQGHDEPIIDKDLPIIDAHHHLIDRAGIRYMIDDYLRDTNSGHRVVASVYVETMAYARMHGPEVLRPLGEIEFANGIGAMCESGRYGCRACAAIVGHADLRLGDEIAALLDQAMIRAPERFRGVRQVSLEHPSDTPYKFIPVRPPTGILRSSGVRRAFYHLNKRDLSFDATVFHHQLPELTELADDFPYTPIILNHCGQMMAMNLNKTERSQLLREYKKLMTATAQRQNIYCKIGGLGMPFWGFRLEERVHPVGYKELAMLWRPFVEISIEAFGVERCMMESNYPPDGRSAGFVPLWNALKHIVSSASTHEKKSLFYNTAAKVYRINTQDL